MGKHTYLDTIENYVKYRANEKRTEFLEKHPEASNQDADALYRNLLELYESNESVRNKLNSEYQDKRAEVQEKYEASMEHARSLGDATENNYKRAETLGPEGLSIASKRAAKTLGPEGRKARTAKMNETLGSEGRKARTAKGKETLGPDGRSAISFKRAKTIGTEGLSEVAKKTVNKCKEIYGEDWRSDMIKEHAVPVRIASVEKRVEEDYTMILSKLPKYFESNELKSIILQYFSKDSRSKAILNSNLVNKKVKSFRIKHMTFNIHENLSYYSEDNTIEDVVVVIQESNKDLKGAQSLKFLAKVEEVMKALPDTGITHEMLGSFMYAKKLRPFFDIETEVLGRTGKPIWRKCTWKKKST